jgi:Predicted double-stranded RNA/RNA-DNA hybrid binding protein
MAKFYAVRKGHRPGIYNTWADCEKAAKGFSGAEFKSFKTKAEAERFMNNLKDENKKYLTASSSATWTAAMISVLTRQASVRCLSLMMK